jgi:hypothetical protein
MNAIEAGTSMPADSDGLAALYRERDALMRDADAIATAIGVLERRRHYRTEPPVALRVNGDDIMIEPSLVDMRHGGVIRSTAVSSLETEAIDDDDETNEDLDVEMTRDEKEDADPAAAAVVRTPDASALVSVIGRSGRFLYRDQIERELIRDGRSFGDDLTPMLKRLVADGRLVRVRYNRSNRCVGYGLPLWLHEGRIREDCEPIGRQVERHTAELTLGGGD